MIQHRSQHATAQIFDPLASAQTRHSLPPKLIAEISHWRSCDTVRGSDHFEIGTVKDVVAVDAKTEAHIVVPSGLIFSSDIVIPLDAVVRRAGDQVFVNVPKLVVGAMPWDNPPAKRERKKKYGLPASAVDNLYGSRTPSADDRKSATATK